MDHLPLSDIPMLVSSINFLLRDEEFDNLDQICYAFNVERSKMDGLLASRGYIYDEKNNHVRLMDIGSAEQAYCFFHQKWTVYAGRSSEVQKDDIEYAISSYANSMNRDLFDFLSDGNPAFLHEHSCFGHDMAEALGKLEKLVD